MKTNTAKQRRREQKENKRKHILAVPVPDAAMPLPNTEKDREIQVITAVHGDDLILLTGSAEALEEHRSAPSLILTASDLKLIDVPEHARESVRAFLAPFLQYVPVREAECLIVAKLLMQIANSPRVEYIEGVWSHRRMPAPVPHAWNTVDGHLVDLIVEYKDARINRWCAESGEEWPYDWPLQWQRTPLKSYSTGGLGTLI
jgi:hypothetical protein